MFRKLQAITIAFVFLSVSLTSVHAQVSREAQPFPNAPMREPALAAVSAMYSTDASVADDFAWMYFVCNQMISTASCSYFRNNQADMIWDKSQDVIGGDIIDVSPMQQDSDGSQLWKMTTVTYTRQRDALCHLVVIRVIYDATRGGWMLDRVLYGPYTNP